MTKIEAVGNKDKLQEKAAQQNWEGPTKTKGEAKQEAFSTPPTTTSTATVKNQPAAFSLPPQSKPIDARGPSVESTLNPSLNASKPSSIPPVAQKTETYAEVAASKPKPSATPLPDERTGSQKYTQDSMIGSVDMRPDDGWSGVKNILVEDAKEAIKAPAEYVSNALHTTQEKTKEFGEKVKEFVTPSTDSTTQSPYTSPSSRDNPKALEAVDRTTSIAFSPSIGLATTNTETYAKDTMASARSTSSPVNRREEMWRGAAESTGRDFGAINHGEGQQGAEWARGKASGAVEKIKEDAEWGADKLKEKTSDAASRARADYDWAKDKARENVDWTKDKARFAEHKAVEGARQAKSDVENKASGLAQRAKDDVEWAKDKFKENVDWAKDKVKEEVNWAKGKVDDNVDWAKDKAREDVDWAKAKTQEAEIKAKSDWGKAKDKAKEATWSAAHTAKDNIDWAKEKTAEAGWKAQSSDNIEWAKDKAGYTVESAKDKAWNAAETVKEDLGWGAQKAKEAVVSAKDTIQHAAESAKEKTKDVANKTYEGAKYEADVVRDSTGRFIEREKSALKEDAKLVKDKVAAVGGGAVSALESATDVVLREARDFGKAIVNTAEDVKGGLLESKDELKQAASEKTQEWKGKAEDFKRTAADKTQELKDKAATTLQHGKEKVETFSGSGESSWGPAEAAKQHGGDLRDKTRVFAEDAAASGSDGSILKEGDVRQAIEQSKKIEEERHEGILSSMIHWMFRGGEPSTTTTSSDISSSSPSSVDDDIKFNQRLERLNSIAYSPAIGSTLDVAPAEVSAKELAAPHASSFPVIPDASISSTSPSLFEESPTNKTSASSSYFQPYSTETEKKEVEERVLEQTIDFFY